jgi:uncharacterized membrane protein YgcG
MRRSIECGVVFGLLTACNNLQGDGQLRRGDTEATSSSTTSGETGEEGGCVRTQGYWKNHSALSEQPHNQIAWPISESTAICDSTWFDVLWTPPHGDAWIILAHQYIAASLNVAAGASAAADVQAALDEAGDMFDGCAIADGDRAHALELADMLDAYNNGTMGTDHCGDDDEDEDDEGGGDDDDHGDDDAHDEGCDDKGGTTTSDDDDDEGGTTTSGGDDDEGGGSTSGGSSSGGSMSTSMSTSM